MLRAGALAAPMRFVEERTVGPSLGQDNINACILSMQLGMTLVLLFTLFYYRIFGVAASLALGTNIVLLVAIMSILSATLTLPGIAGIVLTVGMAIDANVLIFSRIKEELKQGTEPLQAIDQGYDKAFLTILDANLTTLLVAVILYSLGTGPIKGFSVTLSIGILTSMFTAILGTRVGSKINFGLESEIKDGNVISIQNIPDGTIVCNVEKHFGDGGALIKSAGGNATVFTHTEKGVTLKLASGKFTTLNPKNRAMIGTLAGGGVGDRPFMRAGVKWRRFRSKGQKYPIVRGVAQAAYVHPHGGGRHQHVGQSSTVSRNAPPGAKVGSIAARNTGRARSKERK